MKVEKKDLGKAQVELTIELSSDELAPYVRKGAKKISEEIKIDGFRPGHVPMEILKRKVGEMAILEEAARLAIAATADKAVDDNAGTEPIGRPEVNITKLAPGNALEYKIRFAVLPEVALGEYKDLKIKQKPAEIKDEEIDKIINQLREMKAVEKIADKKIADGDKVIADIYMFLDRVPLEGGQGKGTVIIIGRDYVVSGFDKKLIGAVKGDAREFSLPYPKDFHQKNLAGKMVDFKVDVKEIYERIMPELNDEFAVAFGVKKFEELRNNIAESLKAQKENEESLRAEREMLDKILDKTKFGGIPQLLVDHEVGAMMAELEHGVSEQGGKFEDYLLSIGKTMDQLTLEMLPQAVKRAKASLLIREIAHKENIRVEDKEIDDYIDHLLSHHRGEVLKETAKSHEHRHYVSNMLANRKVVEKLRKWNIVK